MKNAMKKWQEKNPTDFLKSTKVCLLAMEFIIRRFTQTSASRVSVDEKVIISLFKFPTKKR